MEATYGGYSIYQAPEDIIQQGYLELHSEESLGYEPRYVVLLRRTSTSESCVRIHMDQNDFEDNGMLFDTYYGHHIDSIRMRGDEMFEVKINLKGLSNNKIVTLTFRALGGTDIGPWVQGFKEVKLGKATGSNSSNTRQSYSSPAPSTGHISHTKHEVSVDGTGNQPARQYAAIFDAAIMHTASSAAMIDIADGHACQLCLTPFSLLLRDRTSRADLYEWPYLYIRKYYPYEPYFAFETGREAKPPNTIICFTVINGRAIMSRVMEFCNNISRSHGNKNQPSTTPSTHHAQGLLTSQTQPNYDNAIPAAVDISASRQPARSSRSSLPLPEIPDPHSQDNTLKNKFKLPMKKLKKFMGKKKKPDARLPELTAEEEYVVLPAYHTGQTGSEIPEELYERVGQVGLDDEVIYETLGDGEHEAVPQDTTKSQDSDPKDHTGKGTEVDKTSSITSSSATSAVEKDALKTPQTNPELFYDPELLYDDTL